MAEKKQITPKEKQIAAASYFFTFYKEITTLNHYEAQYLNILAELKSKYNEVDLGKISEMEKDALIQQVQLVRYHTRKCWVMYSSIVPALKLEIDKKLEVAYKHIKDTYMMNLGELDNFVIGINSILINSVIQDLLDTSQEMIENIYSYEDGGENETG